MRGRSEEQIEKYERRLGILAAALASSPMAVREIRGVLANGTGKPSAATVYLWIDALTERGYVVQSIKRRQKIAGKSGTRERVYSVVVR